LGTINPGFIRVPKNECAILMHSVRK
jgi:hypothetical protein